MKISERLEPLSALHLEELQRLTRRLPSAWKGLAPAQRTHGFPGTPPDRTGQAAGPAVPVAASTPRRVHACLLRLVTDREDRKE